MNHKKHERCYYVDWLRVMAMFMIFVFHCSRFFDHIEWHVKNAEASIGFSLFTGFTHQWIIPFFFLLSGAASRFFLNVRTPWQYVGARFKRLLVPYLFGILFLIPPQKYIEAVFYNRFSGNYLYFLPQYFSVNNLWIDSSLRFLGHYGLHLWFLSFLFLFSLTALPLFMLLKKESPRHFILKIASFCSKPGVILLLPVLTIAIIQTSLRRFFPDYLHWADTFYWFTFLIFGYLIFSDKKFEEAISKHGKLALVLGVVCYIGIIFWYLLSDWAPVQPGFNRTTGFIFFSILCSLNAWCWVMFFLYAGQRFMNVKNKTLKYT
ncbi:MAG: acyltransferase family protein, partial [Methanomassiliicoccales archaeon]